MKGTEKEWYLSLRSRKERKGVDGNGIVVAAKIPLASPECQRSLL